MLSKAARLWVRPAGRLLAAGQAVGSTGLWAHTPLFPPTPCYAAPPFHRPFLPIRAVMGRVLKQHTYDYAVVRIHVIES